MSIAEASTIQYSTPEAAGTQPEAHNQLTWMIDQIDVS